MKNLFLPFIFLFLVSGASAQVPGLFSFQGVAKNANGQPLAAGTSIKVRFTVHEGNPVGSAVLVDYHSLNVSQGGIFNVFVGSGIEVGTDIHALDWGNKKYYLQVELAADGINYTDMGTTQFVSVPYSLYASTAKEARNWQHSVPVVQTGTIGQGDNIGSVGPGPRLVWYPKKGAFRTGDNYNGAWEDVNIGNYSFAGNRGIASGLYSAAFGGSEASGIYSFSAGINTKASGSYSSAFGSYSEAPGEVSTALGGGTVAKAFGGVALGVYNDIQDNPSGTYQGSSSSDRIFQIGVGSSFQERSNALTVLRNGNVGIGAIARNPLYILDVAGRPRIRHSNSTAGIYFDNSQGNAVGFVGMKNDNAVGFYCGNTWILDANDGSVAIHGNCVVDDNLTVYGQFNNSDRRLKKDFSKLNNSFTKLNSLQGYHYYWKDTTKSQSLQTGLIAQEVEALFPELVKTDEKGMKSVNYVGLIPHLIEAIKDQNKQIVTLNEGQEAVKQLEEQVRKLTALVQNGGIGKGENNATTSAQNVRVKNP